MTKVCRHCGEERLLEEFVVDRRNKSGYAARCKACASMSDKVRNAANPEANRARVKAWRKAHPELRRAQSRRDMAKAYARDPKRYIAKKREWERANPEKVRAFRIRYAERQAEVQRMSYWRDPEPHRARTRWASFRKDFEYSEVLRRDPCTYCGGDAGHIDHIVPKFAGGEHLWDNWTGSCKSCNSSKRIKPLLVFLAQRKAFPS